MAQYYTLDEAAQRLGLSTDDFRRKLATEWRQTPRRYPDGATLRFQAIEIDELARTLRSSRSDIQLPLDDEPLRLVDDSSSDDFVPLGGDDMVIRREPASSGRLKKSGSDSDVRLDVTGGGVRPSARTDDDSSMEIDLDSEQRSKPPSSKKIKPAPQVTGESGGKPVGTGSDFDLSLSSDSSDEFELQLTDDSDEVDIGVLPGGKGTKAGDSGINLQAPADSGISLEKSSDFELALEGEGPKSGPKSAPKSGPRTPIKAGPKSGPKTGPQPMVGAGDESEFELTLDDSAADATSAFPEGEQKDIFETDFELPALDDESGSEAVALEESDTDLESSDFDLAIDEGDAAAEDESDSQVVALEEDEGGEAAAEGEELDELEAADDVEPVERPTRAVAAAPANWGVLPALVLIPCVGVMAVVGLMSWELVHGMQNYQQPGKATGPIVRYLAETFGDGKLPAE